MILPNVHEQPNTPLFKQMSFIAIIKAVIISYIITIPVFIIFAFILANTDFPYRLISPAVVITTIISILVASSLSTRGIKNKGWLNGCIVGFIYMLVLYIASGIAFNNFSINRYVITNVIIGILAGAIGGIIGINIKGSSYKVRKR